MLVRVLKLDEEKGGGRRERGTSIFRNLSVSNMRMLREERTRIGYPRTGRGWGRGRMKIDGMKINRYRRNARERSRNRGIVLMRAVVDWRPISMENHPFLSSRTVIPWSSFMHDTHVYVYEYISARARARVHTHTHTHNNKKNCTSMSNTHD